MGHDEVKCEARGGVSIENWPFHRRRRIEIGAGSSTPGAEPADAVAIEAAPPRIRRSLSVVAAGLAALVLPLILHGVTIHAPTLRAALETTLTLFAVGAAWLLRSQFAQSRRLRDLLLLCASLALGVMTLSIRALPVALDLRTDGTLASASLWGQLLVAGIFVAAAAVGREVAVPRRGHPIAITGLLGIGAPTIGVLAGLASSAWGLNPTVHDGTVAHVVVFGLVLVAAGLLVYAGNLFALRNAGEADGVAALLAVAAFAMAGAAVSHLTRRFWPFGAIGAGTVLRVVAGALILSAAVMLERRVRARVVRAAALAERRRVARDLHDGLAQDLAFIAAHGAQMSRELGDEHPVVVAARRALAISRSTISDLTDPEAASTAEALDAVAQELRERFDVAIAVNAQIDDPLAAGAREHLSRIAREAIANAARHGQARNVLVSLRRAEFGVALRVVDDGCGIPGGEGGAVPEGFGLRSMRERAGALGGSLTVRRVPEGGTELEVVLP